MRFEKWFQDFIEEKNIDPDKLLKFDLGDEYHMMPVQIILDGILGAPDREREQIKTVLVRIDFHNGDIYHFLTHLAKSLATRSKNVVH